MAVTFLKELFDKGFLALEPEQKTALYVQIMPFIEAYEKQIACETLCGNNQEINDDFFPYIKAELAPYAPPPPPPPTP